MRWRPAAAGLKRALTPPPKDDPATAPEPAGRAGRSGTALSREFSACLIELSIAIHKYAMYPAGHPSLEPAAVRLTDRVTDLLKQRGTLSLGVAKDQLVIEGVATDSHNPLLRELAGRLHRHHLGAVSFQQGVSPHEILQFLKLVAEEPDRTGEPLGLGPRERREQQPNIRLHPVAYDSLRLLDDDGTAEEDEGTRKARTRYAQLWVGLARAAVVRVEDDDETSGESADGDREVPHDPGAVARAISEHTESDAYDQVIVGYLLQIAEELRTAGGADAAQLNQRMAELVSAMEPDALSRLLEMGGDRGQRRQFLMNASQGLKADSVIQLIEAASQSEEQQVSHYMLRMLGKLAQHADGPMGKQREHAIESLQDQVTTLITGWALKDPNPDGYSTALREMATAAPLFVVAGGQLDRVEPRRIVDMAFELDVTGVPVTDAVSQLIETKEAAWLLERVVDNESSALTQSLIGSTDEFAQLLQQLLDSESVEPAILDTLVELVGDKAVEPLIHAVAESESRQVRRLLLDRLKKVQSDVATVAIRYLDDARWYVKRNMLWLLNELDQVPEGFVPDPYLQHEDYRVRYEALRLGTRSRLGRDKAITHGLTDTEEKTVRFALNAALENCPKPALSIVVSRTASGPADLRLLAVRVLTATDDEAALTGLLNITQPKRRLFHWKHSPKSPVYLAALRALHTRSDDRRVRAVLNLARRRRDPEIAAAARQGDADD